MQPTLMVRSLNPMGSRVGLWGVQALGPLAPMGPQEPVVLYLEASEAVIWTSVTQNRDSLQ